MSTVPKRHDVGDVVKAGEKTRKSRKERAAAKDGKPVWRGFVQCELSSAAKDILRGYSEEQHHQKFTDVHSLVWSGYKVSWSVDARTQTVICSVTGSGDAPECNRGLCLTARGRSFTQAASALAFKHWEMLAEEWDQADSLDPDDDYA